MKTLLTLIFLSFSLILGAGQDTRPVRLENCIGEDISDANCERRYTFIYQN